MQSADLKITLEPTGSGSLVRNHITQLGTCNVLATDSLALLKLSHASDHLGILLKFRF